MTLKSPARIYAIVAGLFLTLLGSLSLVFVPVEFDTVGDVSARPEFLIWSVTGWTAVFWISMGALGLAAMTGRDAPRAYACFAAMVFTVAASSG
jgi:hypothetical protein